MEGADEKARRRKESGEGREGGRREGKKEKRKETLLVSQTPMAPLKEEAERNISLMSETWLVSKPETLALKLRAFMNMRAIVVTRLVSHTRSML